MAETSTVTLPVLPLRNGVVFPHMVITVGIESDEARRAVAAAEENGGRLLLIPRTDDSFATVGTIAEIQEISDEGTVTALIAGVQRARVGAGRPGSNEVLWVEAFPVEDPEAYPEVVADMMREYRAVVTEIMEHRGIGGAASRILGIDDPSQLADLAVYSPDLSLRQKIDVLETTDVEERLRLVLDWMNEILADMEIRQKVRDDATERIDKTQREFLLRQQMESIRSELGEGAADAISEYRQKLEDRDLPEKVAEAISQEIDRLD